MTIRAVLVVAADAVVVAAAQEVAMEGEAVPPARLAVARVQAQRRTRPVLAHPHRPMQPRLTAIAAEMQPTANRAALLVMTEAAAVPVGIAAEDSIINNRRELISES
jgi:hypothetical protein